METEGHVILGPSLLLVTIYLIRMYAYDLLSAYQALVLLGRFDIV
jgi:hypothetical protein